MQYRIDTQTVTDEERRAILWATTGHRTPASREECSEFAEKAVRDAIDAALVPYRQHMAVLNAARQAATKASKK
jgi:hypothetical protein